MPEFQVDQAKQDELNARNRYINSVQGYQAQIDGFKKTLSLPLGLKLDLDDQALEELVQLGLIAIDVGEEDAYRIAVERRLDLLNEVDRFEDSQRKIRVAADRLRAQLNLVGNASLQSRGLADYANFRLDDIQASVGIQLDLPIDRWSERNDYRASLVQFERQARALGAALDDVRNDVRGGLRTVYQARQTYEIQQSAVKLAQARVDSSKLLLQAGRAQIRDLLEAQNALLSAQNAVTGSLVDYHVSRLRFLVDVGSLDTGEDRFWVSQGSNLPGGAVESKEDKPEASEMIKVVTPSELFGK